MSRGATYEATPWWPVPSQYLPGQAPSSGLPSWMVLAGGTFSPALVDPGGLVHGLGARIEAPVTRAIVSAWMPATLQGAIWTATLDAPLAPGIYQLVWMTTDPGDTVDDGPGTGPEFEVFVPIVCVDQLDQSNPGDWPPVKANLNAITPGVDEVASLERTRCKDLDGNDKGTFDNTTFPTGTAVETEVIPQARRAILQLLPDAINPEVYDDVSWAIQLQAAIIIETSYYRVQLQGTTGNQAAQHSSSVPNYIAMMKETVENLQDALSSPDQGTRLA
jgi:hypothetical protein